MTLLHQERRTRSVLHVAYASIASRGIALIVDDMPPIPDVVATIRIPRAISAAVDCESGEELSIERHRDGAVSINLPPIRMHRAIELRHD